VDSLDRDAPEGTRSTWFAIGFLGVLAALQVSAVGINGTALPNIAGDLGMVGARMSTAASISAISAAATAISAGHFADRVGRRRVLSVGLLFGALGSVMTAIAPTQVLYFLAQVLIGVGFGATFGAAFAYLHTVTGESTLPTALGLFGATLGGVSLAFILVGDALPGNNGRLGFVILAAVSIVAVVLVPLVLPAVPGHALSGVDWLGQLLLAGGIASLLVGLSHVGVGVSPFALAAGVVGVALMLAFYVAESKAAAAFFPTALFEKPAFLAALLAGFIYSFGFAAAVFSARLLWPTFSAEPTAGEAVWQAPLWIAMIAGAFVTGRRMSAYTAVRGALFFGAMLTAIGLVALAAASRESAALACLPGLILTGAGAGAVSIPFGYLIIRSAPLAALGPVAGSRLAIGEVGYAIALAMTTVVLSHLTIGEGVDYALTVTLGVAALVVLIAGATAAHVLRGTDSVTGGPSSA